MSEKLVFPEGFEPDRYELREPGRYHFAVDRRDFFKVLGAGVLIIGVMKDMPAAQVEQESGGRFGANVKLPKEISAWLHIGESGAVTTYTGKVEIGQNIRTSLTQAVAEELHVPVEKIELVMGDTQLTPFDLGTVGSRSTPMMGLQLRKVAAAAREVMIGLAADRWELDRNRLRAENGRVIDPESKRAASYAELAAGHELTQTIPVKTSLIPPAEWSVAGRPLPKIGGRDFVTGKHRYPYDQKLPGMLYGKIVRPTAFNATLVTADTRAAEQMPGVTVVRDGNFIGVAASTPEAAAHAVSAITAEWKSAPQPSNKDAFDYVRQNPAHDDNVPEGPPGDAFTFDVGSVKEALASADHKLKQTYTVQYIQHVPLEPRAALAQWTGDQLTVWTGTQRPFMVQNQLAGIFRLPLDKVRVLMPDMGSGYGGKHTGDAAVEAARLARAAGKPVKVCWTREEEFTWAYFRPLGVIDVRSGASRDGAITAWEFHNYNSGTAAIRAFYDIPNQWIEFHPTHHPLRQGSYRGLAATANHFARETHMDELAYEVKMDPLAFRLKNIKDERLRAVFEAAAEKIGWESAKPSPGHGLGIGGGFEKGGYVATCAEVSVDRATGAVRVEKIVTAYECGAIVNPQGLKHQVEGVQIMGLGGALFEAVQFENGRILNPFLSKYRVPRFSDVPPIEVVLIDRKDIAPAGAGETPLFGLAPAIGNAIFAATGVRLRALPLVPDGLKTT